MTNYKERLAAKVEAHNILHEAANSMYEQLVPIFKPLLGCKVIKADGYLLSKIKETVAATVSLKDTRVHFWQHTTRTDTLAWSVKSCVNANGRGYYAETVVEIGELAGSVLRGIRVHPNFRVDYKVEEIEAAREAYAAAKKAADTAYSALFPFGENDFN